MQEPSKCFLSIEKKLRTLFPMYIDVANTSSGCIVLHYWIVSKLILVNDSLLDYLKSCNETSQACGSRSHPIPFVPLELWGLCYTCNTRKMHTLVYMFEIDGVFSLNSDGLINLRCSIKIKDALAYVMTD